MVKSFFLVLALVAHLAAAAPLGCSPDYFYNGGLESPKIPDGASTSSAGIEGWQTSNPPPLLWRRGYMEGVKPVEGEQAVVFESSRHEMWVDMELRDIPFLFVAFSYYPIVRMSGIEVKLGEKDKEQSVIWGYSVQVGAWVDVWKLVEVPKGLTAARLVVKAAEDHKVFLDALQIIKVGKLRTIQVPPKANSSDYLAVVSNTQNELPRTVTIKIEDEIGYGLRGVPGTIEVLKDPKSLPPGEALRRLKFEKGLLRLQRSFQLQCGDELEVRYGVQMTGIPDRVVTPVAHIVSRSDDLLTFRGPSGSVELGPSEFPTPSPSQYILNGGFEETALLGLEVVNVTTFNRFFNWESSLGFIALWRTGRFGVYAAEGQQFAEVQPLQTLSQDLSLPEGAQLYWSLKFRGFKANAKLAIKMGLPGSTVLLDEVDGDASEWRDLHGAYDVPLGQSVTRFEVSSLSPNVKLLLDDVRVGTESPATSTSTLLPLPPCDCDCCK